MHWIRNNEIHAKTINMNKSDLDHHSIWRKLGTNISYNIVKSMTYKCIIIEWE